MKQESAKSRRTFLLTSMLGSSLPLLSGNVDMGLPKLRASELTVDPTHVRFGAGAERWVRLLEQTPRDTVIEVFARAVKRGEIAYRELLTTLFLAGIRNVQPRPSVGFKFHAVLVVHSAHLAALGSTDQERWHPIFWALDAFKNSQQRDREEGNWTMSAVDESNLPAPRDAWARFKNAMNQWDPVEADVSAAALVRGQSAHQVLDAFATYAVRDFRSIGHKAIYLANAYRTLETIGWQHAEPVMRSLAYALLNHVGEPNPAENDLDADRDGRRNHERITDIRKDWFGGQMDAMATLELLAALRHDSADACCELAIQQINMGISVQSIYDAIFQFAAELTMRQPAIVPLHAMTTSNAIHYLFRTCGNQQTRLTLLLQNVAFMPRFRDAAVKRGKLAVRSIENFTLANIDPKQQQRHLTPSATQERLASIFATLGNAPEQAAEALYQALSDGITIEDVIHKSRQLIFLKGNDSHDYKYSSAVLEDVYRISPQYRNRYLAASLLKMRNELETTTPLVQRIREALGPEKSS